MFIQFNNYFNNDAKVWTDESNDRFADAESYFCFTIFYDPEIPLEIKVGGRNGFDLKNKTGEFTDLCAFCKVPDFLFLYTVATPLPLSLDCNRPSSCSPPGVVCNMSDTIPKACSTTTEPITELTTLTVPLTTKQTQNYEQQL
ncbi:Hypothetical predicted protein [Mytilus galloprovincialis]|uniref:Uncharacterized protein n=1 Tax=Mytilus galloprovincialis TaxID=29158 RepID=A0A8B6GT40_MYTGA|nr:Hypothetical predicted protein [Mytilus galloprovincialis]